MTEAHSSEVERVQLHISDARARAQRAADQVAKDGGEPHIVEALEQAERDLGEVNRRLAQGTFYAVPDGALQLGV